MPDESVVDASVVDGSVLGSVDDVSVVVASAVDGSAAASSTAGSVPVLAALAAALGSVVVSPAKTGLIAPTSKMVAIAATHALSNRIRLRRLALARCAWARMV